MFRPFNCGIVSSRILNPFCGRDRGDMGEAPRCPSLAEGQCHFHSHVDIRERLIPCSSDNAFAGVTVLSEVAERLMMMSGSGASTCATEYGRTVASRNNEVTQTTVPAGHRRPSGDRAENKKEGQAVLGWPHSKEVPSTQMQWRIMAIFRAIATLAFFIPTRLASFMPQAFREDHFLVRCSSTVAASNR